MPIAWTPSGELYSLAAAFVWATGVILFRRSGDHVPPVALNLFKGLLATLLLLGTMAVLGRPFFPDRPWSHWAWLLASGVVGIGIADSLFLASLNRLGAGGSAIVDCLYSPFTVLLAWLLLGEPIGLVLILALVLMVGGIFIGTWEPPEADNPEARRQNRLGIGLGALSMLFMALGIVMAKPVLDRSELLWAVTVRLVGGTAFLVVQGLTPRHRADVIRTLRPGRHWSIAVPASVVGTYVAMIVWLAGMKYTRASISSVLNQTSTLLIPLLAVFFLRERLTWRKALAVGMGFAGAVLLIPGLL